MKPISYFECCGEGLAGGPITCAVRDCCHGLGTDDENGCDTCLRKLLPPNSKALKYSKASKSKAPKPSLAPKPSKLPKLNLNLKPSKDFTASQQTSDRSTPVFQHAYAVGFY